MANPPPPPQNTVIPILPPYSDSLQWIELVEAVITDAGVQRNMTKFLCLYKALPIDVQETHQQLLTSGAATSYNDLVAALKDKHANNSTRYLNKLLTAGTMGELSPKEYLRQIRADVQKAGLVINPAQLRQLYLQGIDSYLQQIVGVFDAANIDTASERAEEIWRANKEKLRELQKPYVAANYQETKASTSYQNQIADLTKKVQELTTKVNSQPKSQSNQEVSSRPYNDNKSPGNNEGNYQRPFRGSFRGRGGYQGAAGNNRGTNQGYVPNQIRYDNQRGRSYRGNSSTQRGNSQGSRGGYNNFNQSNRTCLPLPSQFNTYGLCEDHGKNGSRANEWCVPKNGETCNWREFKIRMSNYQCVDHWGSNCPWREFFSTVQSSN